MSEVELDGAGILAVVGEFEAGRVAQHVWVDWHAEFGGVAGAGNQLSEGGCGHRCATLGNKHVGGLNIHAVPLEGP